MKLLQKYGLPVVLVVVAVLLAPAAVAKLAGVPAMHTSFAILGLPAWFGYFIGACELAAVFGLFIRPLRALAAGGVAVIMLGALYFHAVHPPLAEGIPALVILALCGFIVWRVQRPGATEDPVTRFAADSSALSNDR